MGRAITGGSVQTAVAPVYAADANRDMNAIGTGADLQRWFSSLENPNP